MQNRVFKTDKLPFVELRYISHITSCDKKHQHEELTLTAIKSGTINIVFNNKSDSLKEQEISIVNPHEVHCGVLSNMISKGCYVLYLNQSWCEDIQKSLFENGEEYIPIKQSLIQNKDLYKGFLTVCDKLLLEEITFLEKEERLIEFISEVFLRFCLSDVKEKKDSKNFEIAYKIKQYIKNNIENEISLNQISKEMKFSIVHILRVFKKEFGLPIHSYILNKKVHLAKELLSQNMPVCEVAQMSGFFDQSHLNKSFKRVFQLTPKEYQKQIFS